MTREEKLKMLLHPEQYTDEQMDQMLDETEVSTPDANEEWRKFETEHFHSKFYTLHSKLIKIAAMFVGVLMLSGIAYAAYRMVGSIGENHKSPTQETRINSRQQGDKTEEAKDSTVIKPVVYEDTELGTILNEIATFYQYEVVYKSEASKRIRLYFTWDKKATIDDIIDTFNKFERIHITRDNKKLIVE